MAASGSPYWVVRLEVRPEVVFPEGERATREEFFAWVWQQFLEEGLTGVHEGTVLSDEAHAAGLETESWVLDSAQAPHFRDWIGQQGIESPELYFSGEPEAQAATEILTTIQGCRVLGIRRQDPQDWDAEWKKNFKGVEIPSFGMIVPPWELGSSAGALGSVTGGARLILNPGAGFGTGTHETTQLCLQAMSEWREAGGRLERVLDFGSGSGILAIGAALKGAGEVHAVEIDPLAVENARENARLNSVERQVIYSLDFDGLAEAGATAPDQPYDLVFANILRPVLIQFSEALCSRVKRASAGSPGGCLVLSGLVEEDLAEVVACYSRLLSVQPIRMAKNEWRALRFN